MSGMTQPGKKARRHFQSRYMYTGLLAALCMALPDPSLEAQIPRDQVHLGVSLGGFVRVGVGFTHWIEEHHAMEVTAYPLAFPWHGLSLALRGGYNWIPSNEVWRAKLGASATFLIHKPRGGGGWVTPLLSFTPGVNYTPEDERCIRVDLPMAYFPTQKTFAPTGIELYYGLRK